ncbi:MAG TPA: ribosome recycling factor [Bdellovibrionota bacterium]|nr:ribosome recycling factor [Bdellovibrionota bacterium]
MSKEIVDAMKKEMDKSLQSLQRDFLKVRTGRASTALVEGVHVDYYGSNTPVNQVANLSTPDARTIQIVPWEPGMLAPIEKAILAANLGLTPQSDGKVIRINMPALTEDRRKEMVKTVKKMGEEAKVAIRNQRRDANEHVKKAEKDGLSQDEAKKTLADVQKVTDDKVAEVDKLVGTKEKEIMTV